MKNFDKSTLRLTGLMLIMLIPMINLYAQTFVQLPAPVQKQLNPSDLKPIDIDKLNSELKWLVPHSNLSEQEIKASSDEYWKINKPGKGSGWKPYKRAEDFWNLRTGVAESVPNLSNLYEEWMSKPHNVKKEHTQVDNQWKFLGPASQPASSTGLDETGLGRVNCLTFDPSNPNIIWAGAAFGGVWRTTNAGGQWETFPLTQFLSIGITDIAVAPNSTSYSQTVYAATGDANAAFGGISCYSIGIIKTTDFGKTWAPTKFASQIHDRVLINRLLVHPENPNHVYAATNIGLFATEDGGETWDTLSTVYVRDMEFKPSDPNQIWAASLYNNGGSTKFGLLRIMMYPREGKDSLQLFLTPVEFNYGEVIRIAVAVNEGAQDYVYVVAARGNGGLHSVIYSPDGTQQWFYMAQTLDNNVGNFTPDLLNANVDDPDNISTPSQGFYDLCIAANPEDPMDVFVGGVNICRFQGNNRPWALNAYWTSKYVSNGISYVHADHHDLKFSKDGILFSANDGGVFKYDMDDKIWVDVSEGLEITQFYRISSSRNDEGIVIGGTQDNGTHLLRYGNWLYKRGGDGMDCQIDPFTDQVMYNSIYYGDFMVSRDGGNTWSKLIDSTVTNEAGAWITPFVIDPVLPDNIYVGYKNLWKATRKGQDPFKKISNFTDNYPIRHIAVARSDNKVIYVIKPGAVWRTTDAGSTWTDIIKGQGAGDLAFTSIAINPKDPLHFWISRGAFVEGEKVFEYKKGLYRYSEGLPNVPTNIIVHNRNNSNNQLFLGTDIGVFFKDDDMKEWQPYGVGLPNVVIQDLDIHYNSGKLRAATFGRGLWEVKIVDCTLDAPALKSNGSNKLCFGDSLVLWVDADFASYQWSTGETSKSITVKETGTYNITVKDDRNCVAVSEDFHVNVITPPDVKVKSFTGVNTFCEGDSLRLDASPSINYESFLWSNGQKGKTIYVKSEGSYSAVGTTRDGCKKGSDTVSVTSIPAPAKPIITVDGEKLTCSEASSYEWYLDGKKLIHISRTITAVKTGNYSVVITNENGCKNISEEVYVQVVGVEDYQGSDEYFTIQPNPAEDKLFITFSTAHSNKIELNINDLLGNQFIKSVYNTGTQRIELDLSNLSAGIYLINISIGNDKYVKKFIKQ